MPTTHGWIVLCIATTWMIQPRAPGTLAQASVRPRTIAFTGPPLPPREDRPRAILERRSPVDPPPPTPGTDRILAAGFRF